MSLIRNLAKEDHMNDSSGLIDQANKVKLFLRENVLLLGQNVTYLATDRLVLIWSKQCSSLLGLVLRNGVKIL